MTMAAALGAISRRVSGALGAGYFDGTVSWPGAATYDTGGSISTPGVPVAISCDVQVDQVTEAMRGSAEYRDQDMRLLVLADGLERAIDTDATVAVSAGPYAGTRWRVVMAQRDPAAAYFECLGRRA